MSLDSAQRWLVECGVWEREGKRVRSASREQRLPLANHRSEAYVAFLRLIQPKRKLKAFEG